MPDILIDTYGGGYRYEAGESIADVNATVVKNAPSGIGAGMI